MLAVLLFAIVLCASSAQAAGPPPGFHEQFPPIESPNRTYVAEFYIGDVEAPRQLWIRSRATPEDAAFVYEYERNASVLFSPDESWLIVNDAAGSNLTFPVLFKHEKGALFSRLNVDVSSDAWRLLQTQNHLSSPLDLAHTYAVAWSWAADSSAFLLSLSGHTDLDHHVDGWLCVFDLKSRRATADLSLMNRGAVHISQSGKQCLRYEPAVVTLKGKLVLRTFFGPPNYGENPESDSRETHAVLQLDKAICVLGDPSSETNSESEKDQRSITLVPGDGMSFGKYEGSRMVVRGTLFHAHTAHHRTPLLLTVTRIVNSSGQTPKQ